MNNIGTQAIKTQRLILRKMEKDDAQQVYENWTSDALVYRYRGQPHKSLAETRKYIDVNLMLYEVGRYLWVIELEEEHQLIGAIDSINFSELDKTAEIGYTIGSKFWGKGYATEALQAVIDFFFNQVGAEKVIACHISTNPASGKVMQKAGMHLDAILPKYLLDEKTGNRQDKVWYSIDNPNLSK